MSKAVESMPTPSARRRGRPPRNAGRNGAGQVQSLSRALTLLERIAASETGISLSDLAQQVGLAASTTHRLLNTLEQHGFAALDTDRGVWFVGVKAFTVGNAFLACRDVVSIARPFMRNLMEESGESVNLAILDDGQVVFLAQVQCREMMRMLVRLGGRAPVHASGAGKALLAALPEAQMRAELARHGLTRFTDNTLDTSAALAADLARVRARGFAYDDEEHAVGLRCVAATLHDEHGDAVAAISLSGPRARMTDARIARLGRMVLEAAEAITRAMGGRSPVWRRAAAGRDEPALARESGS
jgi:IclR family acetate operon transcriptional repressor